MSIVFTCLALTSSLLGESAKQKPDSLEGPPFVTCKAWAIADGRTGELLWTHAADVVLPMASTTKIMTALLVLRLAEKNPALLDEVLTISKPADATGGTTAGLKTGERLTVRDVLHGLMLPSGNDAANALAEHCNARFAPPEPRENKSPATPPAKPAAPAKPVDPSGEDAVVLDPKPKPAPLTEAQKKEREELNRIGRKLRENFVAEMNRVARALGMSATHYSTAHGMDADGHQSTCRDLIKLAVAARQNAEFRRITSTTEHTCDITAADGTTRMATWTNSNKLLAIEGYDGVKTGTTPKALACLVSSAHRGDDHLLAVVLGSTSTDARYVDTRNLFRWAWSNRQKSFKQPDKAP